MTLLVRKQHDMRDGTCLLFILAMLTGGAHRLAGQNMGIGTSSPTAKLEVAGGDAKIYGLTVRRGSGSATKVRWIIIALRMDHLYTFW